MQYSHTMVLFEKTQNTLKKTPICIYYDCTIITMVFCRELWLTLVNIYKGYLHR